MMSKLYIDPTRNVGVRVWQDRKVSPIIISYGRPRMSYATTRSTAAKVIRRIPRDHRMVEHQVR